MDYAFAPGATGYDKLARLLLSNRPDTTLVSQRGMNSIAQFFDYLHTTAAVTKPVGDLYVSSHGNDKAWMKIHLDAAQTTATSFEVAAAAVLSGSVTIPSDLNHSGVDLTDMKINLRGCRIGAAWPFVDTIKAAFGDESPVTAPKHFHKLQKLGSTGMMEFLFYGFSIVSKTAYADKAATAAAFEAANLTYHDDATVVPPALWTDWIPTDVSIGHRTGLAVTLDLGQTLGASTSISQTVDFRHDNPDYAYGILGLPAMPAPADLLDALRTALNEDAAEDGSTFSDEHPFPTFERFSQADIDDFVDNLDWKFSWDAKKSKLICVGRQHEYTVLVPITDPFDLKTGTLIYDFYPPAASAVAPFDGLDLTDSTLFYTA
jgi:hypothetical protein